MNQSYHAFENLRRHNAKLEDSVRLGSGIQLASWSNRFDRVTQCSDHHTLSLYCTDEHLRNIAEQIWDRSPASLQLDEKIFASDPRIAQLYRHFLLSSSWQQSANHLTLSTASTLLLTHMVQHYSSVQWRLPAVRGGLAPSFCVIFTPILNSTSASR